MRAAAGQGDVPQSHLAAEAGERRLSGCNTTDKGAVRGRKEVWRGCLTGKKQPAIDRRGKARATRGADKTSLAFSTRDIPGALFKALSVFALRDISLSKIESRPMRGRPWEYVFFVDLLRGDDRDLRNALRHLGEVAELVKVLGIYREA